MRYHVHIGDKQLEVELSAGAVIIGGAAEPVSLHPSGASRSYVLRIGRRAWQVRIERETGLGGSAERHRFRVWVNGTVHAARVRDDRARALEQQQRVPGGARHLTQVRAPMPGLIVAVRVSEGDSVQPGQATIVMEAMKMENDLRATSAGVVRKLHVSPGMAVEKGALLLELD